MIRETRDFGEQHRHLEPGVLAAMHEAKFFRMMIPADTGGLQTDLTTAMKVVETIAAADGATGWNLMIGAAYGVWASRLGAEAAREIYGAGTAVVAGALRPTGKARIVDGGFIAEGRWSFASGIGHSAWWAAGCVVHDDDAPRKTASGGRNAAGVLPGSRRRADRHLDRGRHARHRQPRLCDQGPVRSDRADACRPTRRRACPTRSTTCR